MKVPVIYSSIKGFSQVLDDCVSYIDPLNKENIAKINKLYEDGNEITYWTARGSFGGIDYYSLTKQQLDHWGAKYHELSVAEKPLYDLVIDDKAKRIEEL